MSIYYGHQARGFTSQEEMRLWVSDKRYKGNINERDETFIAHVEHCLMLTSDEHLGLGYNLVDQMGDTPAPDYQDPTGTLGRMTDVYRDFEEARLDQSSKLYKTSAFERERVAQKIGRSVPDETVMSGSERYDGSVQTGGDEGQE